MLFKIQKRLFNIKYAIDDYKYENNVLIVKGWIFSSKYKVDNMRVLIKTDSEEYCCEITVGVNRFDVYNITQKENAKKSGFQGQILIENLEQFDVWLTFEINHKKCKFKVGSYETMELVKSKDKPIVQSLNLKNVALNFKKIIDGDTIGNWGFSDEFYDNVIDIIVPVYNGYQYLEKLFETVEQTKMKYRLIVLNDNSSDKRVSPFLKEYASKKENVILIENSENLGFVQNVNKGLQLTEGHVVLLNTDVELPVMWLERLIYPILRYEDVATATPYTNCGTIVSFPNLGKDNDLYMNLTVQEIDDEFAKIVPCYASMPTGVGFCMAMNKNVIDKIGLLDAENFGKGYGEENDWCQRAIQENYRNVQVENLFVYHKHGGSFLSEDKKRYIEENSIKLEKKHPTYNKQVARFFAIDINKNIRNIVKYQLVNKYAKGKVIVAFDHSLGGGASSYLVNQKNIEVDNGNLFYIVRYNVLQNLYQILLYCDKEKFEFYVETLKEVFDVLQYIKADAIWINEVVSYPKVYDLLFEIKKFSNENNISVKMLLHDYYAICPMVNLINSDKRFCDVPSYSNCTKCFNQCCKHLVEEYESIKKWRNRWGAFLKNCNEIIVFSNDSKKLLEKAYKGLDNIKVEPHQMEYISPIKKQYKTSDTFTIGLLGILSEHKGSKVVEELIRKIEKEKLNIKIVLIGSTEHKIASPVFKETGRYSRDSLPRLTLQHDIDVFLISSICPETFSFTAEEVMKMGMPAMCFNIGAPAERVSKYNKGIIIPEISADAILSAIRHNSLLDDAMRLERKKNRVLFVTEEDSFASRYRVQHLREQLLLQGIPSQCVMSSDAAKCKLEKFDSIVLYRCSKMDLLEKVFVNASKLGKKVFYDIDDFIFEHDKIKELGFLQDDDYKEFHKYSANIKKVMYKCDGYIVSTMPLKEAIEESFPGKPVVINKNVFSMAMDICSKKTWSHDKKDKIYLGYFSGTKTHNEDFESIKNQVLKVMIENENVYLLIGGQITLPDEFSVVTKRIETFSFMDWRNLPRMIGKADINLMPLETTFFHACKSANKWMEAAMVHVPTVATWNEELERAIEHGVDGYLCKSVDEWTIYLQKLVDSSELRKKIANAAYEKVMENYNTRSVEQEVLDLLLEQ